MNTRCPHCAMVRRAEAGALDTIAKNIEAHRILQVTVWRVRKARREALREPLPRRTCPGCFSPIYDGAAEQGWCCDCFPKRKHYEQDAKLPAFAPRASIGDNGSPR